MSQCGLNLFRLISIMLLLQKLYVSMLRQEEDRCSLSSLDFYDLLQSRRLSKHGSDCSIFIRSNASLRSPDFTMVTSRNWTRSNVVKRAPQDVHWRRRRMAVASSVGRLSLT